MHTARTLKTRVHRALLPEVKSGIHLPESHRQSPPHRTADQGDPTVGHMAIGPLPTDEKELRNGPRSSQSPQTNLGVSNPAQT